MFVRDDFEREYLKEKMYLLENEMEQMMELESETEDKKFAIVTVNGKKPKRRRKKHADNSNSLPF